jgi:hypothetical protein
MVRSALLRVVCAQSLGTPSKLRLAGTRVVDEDDPVRQVSIQARRPSRMRSAHKHGLRSRAVALLRKAIRRAKTFVTGSTTVPSDVHKVLECKEIVYRGGIVRFKIPKHWIEEYEPAGGAAFFEDHPDTSILRLQVVGFQSKEPVTVASAIDSVTIAGDPGFSDVVITPEGNAIAKKLKRTTDDGEEITIYFWVVGNPTAPRSLRIAHFSFTVLTSLENAPQTLRDLAFLNDSIEHAEFHPDEGIAGDYFHESGRGTPTT